jgi:serine/threonine protein kinase
MAEVFEAELTGELGFARRVAIKRMLVDAAADPRAARRFLDEARIASRLHHANIVAVTDVGLLDELPFQVLELVDGLNAQQLVQRAGGRLPLEVALAIAAEVAHALDHAHAARDPSGAALGVVHRDVKPSNILVSFAGDVKLADFGIALARDRSSRTETGVAPGTLGFMAPEQRTRAEIDGRADVFALGLTLHALVTGHNPLQDLAVEIATIEGQPIPLDAGLPDDVRDLIARAVAPARLDRPAAAQLARSLGAALAPRLSRDARSLLRGFIEPFSAKPPAAGALDHLLGVDVIPADPAPGEVPRYHTRAAAAPPARSDAATAHPSELAPTVRFDAATAQKLEVAATVAVASAPAPSPSPAPAGAPASSPVAPGRGGRRLTALSFAVLALGAGGLGAWRLSAGSSAPSPSSASSSPDAAATLALAPAGAPADASSTPADPGPAPLDVAPVLAPVDAAPAPIDARPRHRTRPTASLPAPPDTAAVPTETGWLLIYGDDLVGARVLVDGGKWTGSVPNAIEVPIGKHSVVVERRDGTRLPPKQAAVTSFHSAVRPLRITW